MTPHVLGVGYSYNEYSVTAQAWKEYGIEFDYADDIKQAAAMLSFKEYICIAICADVIPQEDLDVLRKVRPVPIIVVPPAYSETQRYACVHFGVALYLHTYHHPLAEATTDQNSMLYYMHIPTEKRKPLTIITVKDLSFCLEYRSVEVRGQEIDLTAKEFDILALLIMNQRRVFTYEMLSEQIWHEQSDYYTKKTLITHVSTLRKKLRIAEDVPDYIKSVHGKGYKFDAGY